MTPARRAWLRLKSSTTPRRPAPPVRADADLVRTREMIAEFRSHRMRSR